MTPPPGAPAPVPWEEAMGAGLGLLRLPADQFWRLTPRELAAALGALAPKRAAPLPRARLDALMARFPDGAERRQT